MGITSAIVLYAVLWWLTLLCVVLIGLMKRANAKDPFFLPILIRSLTFRRLYAPRQGPTEIESVRPSLPKRALHA